MRSYIINFVVLALATSTFSPALSAPIQYGYGNLLLVELKMLGPGPFLISGIPLGTLPPSMSSVVSNPVPAIPTPSLPLRGAVPLPALSLPVPQAAPTPPQTPTIPAPPPAFSLSIPVFPLALLPQTALPPTFPPILPKVMTLSNHLPTPYPHPQPQPQSHPHPHPHPHLPPPPHLIMDLGSRRWRVNANTQKPL
jgi:hypothetical protein